MKLTEEQKNKVRALFGADTEKANEVIEKIASLRGKMKLFTEDGEVALTADELEKKLAGKEEKAGEETKTTKETSLEKIQRNVKEIKGSVRGLSYDQCEEIKKELIKVLDYVAKTQMSNLDKKLEEARSIVAELEALKAQQA